LLQPRILRHAFVEHETLAGLAEVTDRLEMNGTWSEWNGTYLGANHWPRHPSESWDPA
jgi:hypothetical protein